ncbi:hypothetical protein [Nocardioides mangrovicus]|uniref:hypothetical protein n=1 Tax=Nocardioides mangrovicus TaxID=2478913 RepID=UPI0011C4A5CA|nr:hypothetical protein [Nocardioides mangrovicus]
MPAIAAVSAAPAFAASTCSPVTIDFSSYPTGQSVPSGTSYTFNGVTVTLKLSGDTGADNNSTVYATTTSTKELRFYDLNAKNTAQTITVNFSQQVKNLTLNIVDIDYASSYDDRVVVNTAGYTASKGSSLKGDGSSSSPFYATNQAADGATTNNVSLTWVSATSVNFTYAQSNTAVTGNPHIGLRTIVFTPTSC